jgi:hypothetical protein
MVEDGWRLLIVDEDGCEWWRIVANGYSKDTSSRLLIV